MTGAGCSLTVWSAVGSALANSTLAAVLAGFMINGIILLLGYTKKPKPEYVQAVALLFAAFIALGIDAFLFGVVTGENTAVINGVSACRRAWTESMFAAGLLGIGAVAIVVGFTVLFSVYFGGTEHDGNAAEWKASLGILERLCLLMRGGVAVSVVALLYVTARSYLIAVFNTGVPLLGTIFLYGYTILGIFFILVMTGASLKYGSRNPILKRLKADDRWQFLRAMRWAIYSAMVYSMLSTLMAGAAATISAHFWNPEHPWIRVIFAVTVAWESVVSLVPLLLLLFRTVPGLTEPLPEGRNEPFRWKAFLRSLATDTSGRGAAVPGNGAEQPRPEAAADGEIQAGHPLRGVSDSAGGGGPACG